MSALAQKLLQGLSGGTWLTRERLVGYAAILLFYEMLLAIYAVALSNGLVTAHKPVSMDFVSFYAAGELANAGTPSLAYDQAAHYAAEQRAEGPGISYNYFYYPPVFLMLCALLARLPYMVAYFIFEALTLLVCIFVARRIVKETDWRVLVPLVAFPAVFWTIMLGQNSFLTAALFGAATLLIDRRPVAAGLLFGALAYKPHFGILIPIALAAHGNWRAFIAAGASVAGLGILSIAAFGWGTWSAFLAAAAGSQSVYAGGAIDTIGLATPFGAVMTMGGGLTLAYAVQGISAAAAMAWVALVWRRGLSLPVRAATLLAATPLAVPVFLYYDLVLGAIAMAWLVVAARKDGFLPWEKSALAAIYLATLFTGSTNMTPRLLLPPLVALALFAMTVARARYELAQRGRETQTQIAPVSGMLNISRH